jgi:TatD DNase family protein
MDSPKSPGTPKGYIDVHCHLADPRWNSQRDESLKQSCDEGIETWVQGGVAPQDWEAQLALREKWPGLIPVFGVHPVWAAQNFDLLVDSALDELPGWLPKAKGIGELGLDHGPKIERSSYDRQLKAFRRQLEMAQHYTLPLVLHVVQAHGQALDVLETAFKLRGKKPFRGLVHSFSGAPEVAERYLRLGLSLSVSGVVTHGGYLDLKKAIPLIPADRLLIETDCPDQKPKPFEKIWNEPSSLFKAAEAVSALRNESAVVILERSAQNARKIFGLPN